MVVFSDFSIQFDQRKTIDSFWIKTKPRHFFAERGRLKRRLACLSVCLPARLPARKTSHQVIPKSSMLH